MSRLSPATQRRGTSTAVLVVARAGGRRRLGQVREGAGHLGRPDEADAPPRRGQPAVGNEPCERDRGFDQRGRARGIVVRARLRVAQVADEQDLLAVGHLVARQQRLDDLDRARVELAVDRRAHPQRLALRQPLPQRPSLPRADHEPHASGCGLPRPPERRVLPAHRAGPARCARRPPCRRTGCPPRRAARTASRGDPARRLVGQHDLPRHVQPLVVRRLDPALAARRDQLELAIDRDAPLDQAGRRDLEVAQQARRRGLVRPCAASDGSRCSVAASHDHSRKLGVVQKRVIPSAG